MRILLAAFYTPGIRALEFLFGLGFSPKDVRLLTHDHERNQCLLHYTAANRIEYCTSSVKSPEVLQWVSDFGPDVLLSLYFRNIIPASVLGRVKLGGVNLHPSLLPMYKGTFSVPWVIINGERETGFTFHYMVPQVDSGNILLQKSLAIRYDDTAFSLYHRLLVVGLAHLNEVFQMMVEQRSSGTPQLGEGTYFSRKVPYGGYIDPTWSRDRVERFVRAMYFPPFRGAVLRLPNGDEREILTMDEYDRYVPLLGHSS